MADTRIIHGFHAVLSRLRQHAASIREIYVDAARDDRRARELKAMVEGRGLRLVTVDARRLDGMTGQERHQGVAARVDVAQLPTHLDDVLEALAEPPLLLILDGVTDPHNLGACLRSAEAAGVDAVIVPKDKSALITATVRKVACGAAEVVPFIAVTNLARTLRALQERRIWVLGAAGEASASLYDTDLQGALALVLGSEGTGLRRLTREHCDSLFAIPMAGEVSSLNVSVSAGICLFEAVRQRHPRH